ncbi:MAG TPA: hypothetical protein VMV18_08180, partial [bacterium]|nr:hypothetical protein [bacterium]
MGRRWVGGLSLLAMIVATGCGGKSGGSSNETGRVTVKLIVPPAGSPDPFQNITTLHLEVREGATVVYQTDAGPGVPIVVQGLSAGTNRTVLLQGKDSGGNVVSHGVTKAFDFTEGQSIQVPLYFGRSNSLN